MINFGPMTGPASAKRKGLQVMTNSKSRSTQFAVVASILLSIAAQRQATAQDLPLLATLSTPSVASTNQPNSLPLNDEQDQDRGALLLCGGGPLPASVLELFFQYGKGDEGKLVIIPTASALSDSGDFSRAFGSWAEFNWGKVDILHAGSREEAEAEEFASTLKDATAVWMSGGDQRRLAERYQGTSVESEIRNVMHRGGVVGGTSAGSAIASRVMISGGQKQPQIANGLDLLPNSIIDQHFSQRLRHDRLANAVASHPERVGIGIDESTGLLVGKKRAQVVGNGAVYVYASYQKPVKTVSTDQAEEKNAADSDSKVTTAEFRTMRVAPGEVLESHGFPLLAPKP
jgi:cyanophycinase